MKINKAHEIRLRILSAAGQCFAQYGFEKTTLDDIGRRVGLNKASIYYYYENKESIFVEVIRDEIGGFIQALKGKIENAKGCKNRILAYLTGRLDCYRSSLNLNALSNETYNTLHEFFLPLQQTQMKLEMDIIEEILKDAIRSGEIEKIDVKKTSRNLITICDAIKSREIPCNFNNRFNESLDYTKVKEEIEFVVSLMFKGITRKK